MNRKNWYVVHTKPHKETLAVKNLERQGFNAYCPETIQSKRRSKCWQKIVEPLFPRYLFVQLSMGVDNFAPIRSTLGVLGLVKFGSQPAVISESAIAVIQTQENELKRNCDKQPNWQTGDLLEILEGPFSGMKGVFFKEEGLERVSLLLDILGKQNCVTVDRDLLTLALK